MLTGIYRIKNKINGKVYIGSAVNINSRWRTHLAYLRSNRHHNRYLQSAWNKYGEENFEFKVIEVCDRKDLIVKEQSYIDEHKACDRILGYNLAPTAGSALGVIHTEETRAKLGALRKGKPRTEEAQAKIKEGWLKRKAAGGVSEESRKKMSDAHKGKKHNEETLAKFQTRTLSEEARQKLSLSAKRRWEKRDGNIGRRGTTAS